MGTTYRLVVAYAGGAYFGWQRLADRPTIQGTLEDEIEAAFGERVSVVGAGRTDRGAHAEGQAASFRLEADPTPDEVIDTLNARLARDIRIRSVEIVDDDFHARTSAIGKTYAYVIANVPELPEDAEGRMLHIEEPLDVGAMHRAAQVLVGKHDFASFATKPRFKQKSTVREVYSVSVEDADGLVTITVHADSFLNHMVRNMVRALVKVGDGRWRPIKIKEVLEARDRSVSPGTAPAHGLYLVEVEYPPQESDISNPG